MKYQFCKAAFVWEDFPQITEVLEEPSSPVLTGSMAWDAVWKASELVKNTDSYIP